MKRTKEKNRKERSRYKESNLANIEKQSIGAIVCVTKNKEQQNMICMRVHRPDPERHEATPGINETTHEGIQNGHPINTKTTNDGEKTCNEMEESTEARKERNKIEKRERREKKRDERAQRRICKKKNRKCQSTQSKPKKKQRGTDILIRCEVASDKRVDIPSTPRAKGWATKTTNEKMPKEIKGMNERMETKIITKKIPKLEPKTLGRSLWTGL